MPKIGEFTETEFGFSGAIRTREGRSEVNLVTNDAGHEGGPDYTARAPNGAEVGAGWNKVSAKTGNPYVRVSIDDVTLPQKIQANLVREASGAWGLIWNRENDRGPSSEAQAQPQREADQTNGGRHGPRKEDRSQRSQPRER